MKVLYIIDYGTRGGATHSFLEMVVAMKRLGVEPIVCTSKQDDVNKFLDEQKIKNVAVGHKTVLEQIVFKGIKWPIKYLLKWYAFYKGERKALKALEKTIDFKSISLIHTNSARNDIGCYLNKRYGIPHVMHIREFADLDFNCISFRHDYIKLFNNHTTCFIAISNAIKDYWVDKGIDIKKIETVYNGIHFEDISISDDEIKKISLIKMIIVGGVYPTKGQHLVVEAIGLLPVEIRKNITLDIAGWYNPKYIESMLAHAKVHGYEKQIRILGSRDDVHQILGNYQIGLMCSKAEGFGRTTAEYMHARLGVIASNSGANPELIEDGVTGLLFESGNAQSLADNITRLYNDRDLLVKLSNAAQAKARAMFTQQKNAESIYEVYKQIIKNN